MFRSTDRLRHAASCSGVTGIGHKAQALWSLRHRLRVAATVAVPGSTAHCPWRIVSHRRPTTDYQLPITDYRLATTPHTRSTFPNFHTSAYSITTVYYVYRKANIKRGRSSTLIWINNCVVGELCCVVL